MRFSTRVTDGAPEGDLVTVHVDGNTTGVKRRAALYCHRFPLQRRFTVAGEAIQAADATE